MLLTGEVGAGKTTLTRALVDELDEETYKLALVINPRISATQLFQLMAEKLGLADAPRQKNRLLEALQGRLFELDEQGKTPVLIIDEATRGV